MRGRGKWSVTIWAMVVYSLVFLGLSWRRGHTLQVYDIDVYGSDGATVQTRSDSPGPTKVLFLGYRRGGSSISSEIFDIDPKAVFWYEPLDAFYFSHTGYHGRKDQRVLMYDNESDFRPVQSWEHEGMVSFFQKLYDCDLSSLPSELLAHRFMKHTSSLTPYYECYQRLSPDSITQDLYNCRDRLERVCGRSVENSLDNKCPAIMKAVHAVSLRGSDVIKNHVGEVIHDVLERAGLNHTRIDDVFDDVMAYRRCLNKLEYIIDQCLPKAETSCRQKQLRTAKIVRATMPLIHSIIRAVPDLKIIIFIRDPRAMAYSRSGKDKLILNIINSCIRACKKLEVDFRIKAVIDKEYPDAIKVMRYEDFVSDPHYWAEVMYRHVGHDLPQGLDDFIQSHMYAEEDDGKKWGNIRTNASEIANRWRNYISPEVMSQMQRRCGGLLTDLGYTMY